MKPFIHAERSVKKFGGRLEDYQAIHDFIDQGKMAHPDMRYRAILHHAYGCFIVESVFGKTMVNSDGKTFSPRDIAEQHILDDLGTIPTLSDWLQHMPLEPWMGNPVTSKRTISLVD